MTENQGPVPGAGSQEGDGRRGAEARTRELRVPDVETCQGDQRAGRVWEGLRSKLCSKSWLSMKGQRDRSASPGKVCRRPRARVPEPANDPAGVRRVWGHRARSVRLQRHHRAGDSGGAATHRSCCRSRGRCLPCRRRRHRRVCSLRAPHRPGERAPRPLAPPRKHGPSEGPPPDPEPKYPHESRPEGGGVETRGVTGRTPPHPRARKKTSV